MIGRVTRCMLPHLSGVPHLHVNMLLVPCHTLKLRGEHVEREHNTECLHFWPLKANRSWSWYLGYLVWGFWYWDKTLKISSVNKRRTTWLKYCSYLTLTIWIASESFKTFELTFIHLQRLGSIQFPLEQFNWQQIIFKKIESILLENIYCRSYFIQHNIYSQASKKPSFRK